MGYRLTEDLADHAIDLVQIDVGDDNHDHLVDPDDLIRVAISRQ